MPYSAHACEYIRLRDIIRTYARAGLSIPLEMQKTLKRLGARVAVELDLGIPEHVAFCAECERTVGGPYYYRDEARARLREHRFNLHDVNRPTYVPTERQNPTRARQRGSFVE